MTRLLGLDGVSKCFGPLVVAENISLELATGEALGIIGPNGAGKTTLLNIIAGDLLADEGAIVFDGHDVTTLPAPARCQLGIARTFQIPHPFVGMTVFENLAVSAAFGTGRRERQVYDGCLDVLDRCGLSDKANVLAGALPLLDRKRLELARAMATEPRILLLDEIAGGLTEHEVHDLLATMAHIRAGGMSIIWIEHVVHALLAVVDRLVAVHAGAILTEGDPAEVMASPEVQSIYLGMPT